MIVKSKKTHGRGIRFTALAVAFVFTVTGVNWATPANATPTEAAAPAVFPLDPFDIPKEMGTITRIRRADGGGRMAKDEKPAPSTSHHSPSERFVVLIQDAHAVDDAQENIAKILEYLQKSYGIRLTALEGARSKLDPTLFRAFPDVSIKKKVLFGYLKRGEITGAQMAAIFSEKEQGYYGIEDWKLYEENYRSYLRAQENKGMLETKWKTFKNRLDETRKTVYSEKMNEFQDRWEDFREERTNLAEFLMYLVNFKKVLARDKGLPALNKLVDSVGYTASGDQEKLVPVIKAMAAEFKTKYVRGMDVKSEMNFYNRYQAFLTGQMESGQFLQFMIELGHARGFRPKLTPAIRRLLGHTETLSAIKGSELFSELQKGQETIEASLMTKPEEKELAVKYRRLFLLQELLSLEMTHETLSQYQTDPEAYLDLLGDPAFREGLAPAVEFYRLALERDHAFFKNIMSLMGRETSRTPNSGPRTVAVVAGGFHTNGLQRILEEQRISYAVVSPRMAALAGSKNYAQVMRNNVSYKEFLKTTYYDAFVRDATGRLVKEMNKPDFVRNLKAWRDDVVRDLSRQGRIAEAGNYTRYLDSLAQVYVSKFGKGPARSKEEVLKILSKELNDFRDKSLGQLWQRFESQIGPFIDGLKGLAKRSELNPQNVSALADSFGKPKPSMLNPPAVLDPDIPVILALPPRSETRMQAVKEAVDLGEYRKRQASPDEIDASQKIGRSETRQGEVSLTTTVKRWVIGILAALVIFSASIYLFVEHIKGLPSEPVYAVSSFSMSNGKPVTAPFKTLNVVPEGTMGIFRESFNSTPLQTGQCVLALVFNSGANGAMGPAGAVHFFPHPDGKPITEDELARQLESVYQYFTTNGFSPKTSTIVIVQNGSRSMVDGFSETIAGYFKANFPKDVKTYDVVNPYGTDVFIGNEGDKRVVTGKESPWGGITLFKFEMSAGGGFKEIKPPSRSELREKEWGGLFVDLSRYSRFFSFLPEELVKIERHILAVAVSLYQWASNVQKGSPESSILGLSRIFPAVTEAPPTPAGGRSEARVLDMLGEARLSDLDQTLSTAQAGAIVVELYNDPELQWLRELPGGQDPATALQPLIRILSSPEALVSFGGGRYRTFRELKDAFLSEMSLLENFAKERQDYQQFRADEWVGAAINQLEQKEAAAAAEMIALDPSLVAQEITEEIFKTEKKYKVNLEAVRRAWKAEWERNGVSKEEQGALEQLLGNIEFYLPLTTEEPSNFEDTTSAKILENLFSVREKSMPGEPMSRVLNIVRQMQDGAKVLPSNIQLRYHMSMGPLGEGSHRVVDRIEVVVRRPGVSTRSIFTGSWVKEHKPEEVLRTELEWEALRFAQDEKVGKYFQKPLDLFADHDKNQAIIYKSYIPGSTLREWIDRLLASDLSPGTVDRQKMVTLFERCGAFQGDVYALTDKRLPRDMHTKNIVLDEVDGILQQAYGIDLEVGFEEVNENDPLEAFMVLLALQGMYENRKVASFPGLFIEMASAYLTAYFSQREKLSEEDRAKAKSEFEQAIAGKTFSGNVYAELWDAAKKAFVKEIVPENLSPEDQDLLKWFNENERLRREAVAASGPGEELELDVLGREEDLGLDMDMEEPDVGTPTLKTRSEARVEKLPELWIGGLVIADPAEIAEKAMAAGGIEAFRAELRENGLTRLDEIGVEYDKDAAAFLKTIGEKSDVVGFMVAPGFEGFLKTQFGDLVQIMDFQELSGRLLSAVVMPTAFADEVQFADAGKVLDREKIRAQRSALGELIDNARSPRIAILMNRPEQNQDAEQALRMVGRLPIEQLIVLHRRSQPLGSLWRTAAQGRLTPIAVKGNDAVASMAQKIAKSRDGQLMVSFWTRDFGTGDLGIYSVLAEINRISDPELKSLALSAVHYAILRFAGLDEKTRQAIIADPAKIKEYLDQGMAALSFFKFGKSGLELVIEQFVNNYLAERSIQAAA